MVAHLRLPFCVVAVLWLGFSDTDLKPTVGETNTTDPAPVTRAYYDPQLSSAGVHSTGTSVRPTGSTTVETTTSSTFSGPLAQCNLPNVTASLIANITRSRSASAHVSRKLGGVTTVDGTGTFCWQVAILQSNRNRTMFSAWSGSIIGRRTILTTAHNVLRLFFREHNQSTIDEFGFGFRYPTNITIGVISRNTSNLAKNPYPNVLAGCQKEFEVYEMKVHPGYDPRTHENDLALLTLYDPIDFQSHSRCACPICLVSSVRELEVGRSCVLSGWYQGATVSSGGVCLEEMQFFPDQNESTDTPNYFGTKCKNDQKFVGS